MMLIKQLNDNMRSCTRTIAFAAALAGLIFLSACSPQNPAPESTRALDLPTPTPFPPPAAEEIGETWLHPIDEMTLVYVPAGRFIMGVPPGTIDADETENPMRAVFLDAFWIDQTEVTNGMYALCVLEGGCTVPSLQNTLTRQDYYANLSYAEYPVVNVTWEQAADYCTWAGRRLPTEAEWEKAARGTDGRTFPWGEAPPTCGHLRFGDPGPGQQSCGEDTAQVGSFEIGISPYGAFDLSGNVWEWAADWYAADAYETAPDENPLGPPSGETKVLRGGAFNDGMKTVRATNRHHTAPNNPSYFIGFRCAISALP